MTALPSAPFASAMHWPGGLDPFGAELLQGGELGFRLIPCPWSVLKALPTGPYSTQDSALEAVRCHIAPEAPDA
jgi:hypothetical protein